MNRLLIKVVFCLLVALTIWPNVARCDDKIVFFDGRRILTEFKEFQDAQAELEKEARQWKNELDSLDVAIRQKKEELAKQTLILSEVKKAEREQEIQTMELEFRSLYAEITDPGGRHDQRSSELSKPGYDKVYQVLEKLAIEEGYSMIFDLVNITWAKPDLDITDRILEELEKLE